MATFIQLSPDPYNKKDPTQANSDSPNFVKYTDINRYASVRRPQRGTQMKTETFATLEIKTSDGRNILLLDSGGLIEKEGKAYSAKYSNFLLQNIQRPKTEKYQILETFGQSFIMFFGDRPNIYTISGILFNSADFNWKSEFLKNYDLYIRGTQCAFYKTSAYLSYDDTILRGYIVNSSIDESAENNEVCHFSFQIVIADDISTSNIGDPFFTVVSTVAVDGGVLDNPNITFGKISQNSDEYIARDNNDVMQFETFDNTSMVAKSSDEQFLNTQLKEYGDLPNTNTSLLSDVSNKNYKTTRINGKVVKNTEISDLNAESTIQSRKSEALTKRQARKPS